MGLCEDLYLKLCKWLSSFLLLKFKIVEIFKNVLMFLVAVDSSVSRENVLYTNYTDMEVYCNWKELSSCCFFNSQVI